MTWKSFDINETFFSHFGPRNVFIFVAGGSRQIKIRNRILDVFCFKPPGFDTFQTYFDMSGYVYYGGAGDKRYSKMRIEVHDCLVNVDVLDDSFSEVRYWQEGNPTIVAAMRKWPRWFFKAKNLSKTIITASTLVQSTVL